MNRSLVSALAAGMLTALLIPQLAHTEDGSGPYIQLQGGYVTPNSGDGSSRTPAAVPGMQQTVVHFDTDYDDGYTFGGSAGYVSGSTRVELAVDHLRNRIDQAAATALGGSVISTDTAMLNVWFELAQGKVRPYLGGGLGAVRKSIDAHHDEGAAAQLGIGVDWLLNEHLAIDTRYRYLSTERIKYESNGSSLAADYSAQALTIGLRYAFFSDPLPPPPVPTTATIESPRPPTDSDGDGVLDEQDQCPGTSQGVAVDAVGCPLPPPCKAPEPGQALDLSGCATGDTITLHGVTFEFDKAVLTLNAKTILDGIANASLAAPAIHFEISGHTDSKGSDSYNQTLSEQRAESVATYLESRGVAADRMTSVGYGETRPVADNESEEGRELNRRVELKILESPASNP